MKIKERILVNLAQYNTNFIDLKENLYNSIFKNTNKISRFSKPLGLGYVCKIKSEIWVINVLIMFNLVVYF